MGKGTVRRDTTKSFEHDRLIRELNEKGRALDSIYLYRTYGYENNYHGSMPHTRYLDYYTNMGSTLFWYVKNRYFFPRYMPRRNIWYNEYIDRYNSVVEYYNTFIECTDGHQLAENMEYSLKMAARLGVDTSRNVLLKVPRMGYQFELLEVKKETEQVVENLPEAIDSTELEYRRLISRALPHHTVYLLDVSNSMDAGGKLDDLKFSVKYLVKLQRETDRISVVTFSTHAHTWIRSLPCDRKQLIYQRLDALQAQGSSNADEGIGNAYAQADSNRIEGVNKIVLVTDGKFSISGMTEKLINQRKKETQLVVLLFGTHHDKDVIAYFGKLCKKANGRFYQVDNTNLNAVLVKEAAQ